LKSENGKEVPIKLIDIINNPLSRTIYSNQSGEQGNTLYDYALRIQAAHKQNIDQCPTDVRLIKFNHPLFYTITYNLVTSNGTVTVKTSIVGLIKYRKANGEIWIAFFGTPINEYTTSS
jgi:hypothetical protein